MKNKIIDSSFLKWWKEKY